MAIARVYGTKDTLERLQVIDGTETGQTAKRFLLVDGKVTATFLGDFHYGIFGSPFGTLDIYKYSVGGKLRLKVTDIDADMYAVFTRLDFLRSPWEAEKVIYQSNDRMFGNSGRNLFEGHDGNDRIFGYGDDDRLAGGNGKDTIMGGNGNDLLNGDEKNDKLFGGKGQDTLFGGTGNDILSGGNGADTLSGFHGNDRLDGGRGRDDLTGGKGKDVFVFRDSYGKDTIADFRNDTDKIRLDDALWNGTLNRAQVVNKFAKLINGDVVMDFGKEQLVLEDFKRLNDLADDLIIV